MPPFAWYGFTSVKDRERIEVFLRNSKRAGYCHPDAQSFESVCDDADARRSHSINSIGQEACPPPAPATQGATSL